METLNSGKKRLIQTILCILAMFSVGLSQGVLNPTLPDLQYLTGSTQTQMSFVFVTNGIGSCIGSLSAGPIFNRFNGFICLALAGVLQSVFYAMAPFCPNFAGLIALIMIGRIPTYIIITGTYAIVMKLWKESSKIMFGFIQTLHLMQTFGMAVIPMIAEPFLGDYRNMTTSVDNVTTSDDVTDTTQNSITIDLLTGIGNNMETLFLILGAIDIGIAFLCLLGVFLKPEKGAERKTETVRFVAGEDSADENENTNLLHSGRQSEDKRSEADLSQITPNENPSSDQGTKLYCSDNHGNNTDPKSGRLKAEETSTQPIPIIRYTKHHKLYQAQKLLFIMYLSTACLFFVLNGGRDVIINGLLYNYVTQYLNFSPETGTLLVTVYQLVRTLGQVVVIVLAKWVKPLWIGVADMIALVLASLVLIFTYDLSDISVWVSFIVIGFASCNVYPMAMSIIEETIPVTARISGLLWFGVSLGMMTFTPLTSVLLEVTGSPGVPIPLLASAVACSLLFIPLIVIGRKLNTKDQKDVLISERSVPFHGDSATG